MAKARILAVDDQRYFRELIAGMLADEGFEAVTAASGEEALQVLAASDFDLVLTDLVMPGMDGTELVGRIHERDPDQDVVVVTGVVDVKTAVEAMKLGAADYLLKPFDRETLGAILEAVLQKRRIEQEHSRLLAENIEYIGERSLYERALSLYATLSIDALAMRLADALSLETRAQGAVVWIAGREQASALELAAARGLVRVADESETLDRGSLPQELDDEHRAAIVRWGDDGESLCATLSRDGELVGLVRLTDKLEGEAFDAVDVACVDKFVRLADTAVANALRVRGLERQGMREPVTGAYNVDYFRNVARGEIEKASRFGRSFALLTLDLGGVDTLRRAAGGESLEGFLRRLTEYLASIMRATDLLAVDDGWRFSMLLSEADALDTAVFKRRMLAQLARYEGFSELREDERPTLRAGAAIYPVDGAQLETLLAAAEDRLAEEARSRVATLGLDGLPVAEGLRELARLGTPETPAMATQLTRFALSELARRPRERGLLFAVPGPDLDETVRDGVEALRELPVRTELVVVSDAVAPDFIEPPISWVSPARAPSGLPSCLIHFGDGPAYAVVRGQGDDGQPRLFHTSNRQLVEHLAFQLNETLTPDSEVAA